MPAEREIGADAFAAEVARRMHAAEGVAPAWGIGIEEVRVGYARVSMTVRPEMLNGHGAAHGAILFGIADCAFGYACNSRNRKSVGAWAGMAYLSPAKAGDRLVAEARELSVVGRSGVYRVRVTRAGGGTIAEFQGHSRTVDGPSLP